MSARILLIEDDPGTGTALLKVLQAEGYLVQWITRGDEGGRLAQEREFDLVLTDLKLPGLSGLDLVAQLHAAKPKVPVVLMTAHGTTATAIEATKLGAYEYLIKPFEADTLLDLVRSALQTSQLMSETVALGGADAGGFAIIGHSRVMQALYKDIGRVAATPVSVLIRGATGTGKELVARAIYQHSERAEKPFIAINCAAIPQDLLESELFGHEKGAFTGAQNRRIGRFEQAQGGTIFLDEIGDLPADTQVKLLRVLQERVIQRVGGDEPIPIDVRVLAATHRNLETAIQEKDFREDLYYRLSGVTLHVPPLRERSEDIPELIRYFIARNAPALGINAPAIQPEAIAFLQSQPWPGNVRELENVVRQALLLARPFAVALSHVQPALLRDRQLPGPDELSHRDYVADLLQRTQRGEITNAYWQMIEDLETELFRQAIRLAGGNQAQAARWLGVTRLKMREKLTHIGLRTDEKSAPPPDSTSA